VRASAAIRATVEQGSQTDNFGRAPRGSSGCLIAGSKVCSQSGRPSAAVLGPKSSRKRSTAAGNADHACAGEAPIAQIAKDFGISESCLRNWLHRADVEDGVRSGTTEADAKELRDAKRRIRLLEQENEVLRRAAAYLSQANLPGK